MPVLLKTISLREAWNTRSQRQLLFQAEAWPLAGHQHQGDPCALNNCQEVGSDAQT